MVYFLLILGYLFGSIPSGLILSKTLMKKDIRNHGSGNIGTTNAYRLGGQKLGVLTLLGDMLKALIPILITESLRPHDIVTLCGVGLTVVVGHMFSAFLKFSGGKGVATSLAVLFYISPVIALIAILVFVPVFYRTKMVSLASLSAATVSVVASAILSSYPVLCLVISMFILIILKHKDNIARLIKGKENRI